MPRNANSVNIKAEASYHHGDLRAATLELGLRRIATQDHPELGLRALARELGVSATALYRHFPNKDALLDALAMEGMIQLGASQAKVSGEAGGGRQGFVESGLAYIRWAIANPALFRLTFTRCGRPDMERATGALGEAARQLRDGVMAVMPDASPEDREAAALHAWSLVHGLAQLILDGQVAYDARTIRRVVESTGFGAPS